MVFVVDIVVVWFVFCFLLLFFGFVFFVLFGLVWLVF